MKKIFAVFVTFIILASISAQSDGDISSLKSQLKSAKTNLELFRITGKICIHYRKKGDSDSSRFFLRQLLEIAQAGKNDSLLAVAYNYVGNSFIAAGNYPLTLQYHFKALNLAEKNNYDEEEGRARGNIGWDYILLGNFPAAVSFCQKAIKVLSGNKRAEKLLVPAYDNLAIGFLEQKQADSALFYTQLSNTLNLKVRDTFEQSYIFYQFARAYLLLGESDLAESYFRKCISYSQINNNPEALSTAATHFCRMLLTQNRISEAKEYGLMGMKAAATNGMKRQAIDNAAILHSLYEYQKQTDSAYYYLKLANLYRDSVFSEQKNAQLQDVIFSQQLYEKESAQEREIEEIERKNNLQYAAISLVVVAFVILFLLLSHSIIANQRVIKFLGILSLLIVFEFLNLLLHPSIGNLTHHSPVMMLGIMVCIAALLIPLHHKLEHWITHKLVEKNKRIRLKAAKKTIAQLEGKEHQLLDP